MAYNFLTIPEQFWETNMATVPPTLLAQAEEVIE